MATHRDTSNYLGLHDFLENAELTDSLATFTSQRTASATYINNVSMQLKCEPWKTHLHKQKARLFVSQHENWVFREGCLGNTSFDPKWELCSGGISVSSCFNELQLLLSIYLSYSLYPALLAVCGDCDARPHPLVIPSLTARQIQGVVCVS